MTTRSTNTRIHADLKALIRKRSRDMGVSEVAASKNLADEFLDINTLRKREKLWDFKI